MIQSQIAVPISNKQSSECRTLNSKWRPWSSKGSSNRLILCISHSSMLNFLFQCFQGSTSPSVWIQLTLVQYLFKTVELFGIIKSYAALPQRELDIKQLNLTLCCQFPAFSQDTTGCSTCPGSCVRRGGNCCTPTASWHQSTSNSTELKWIQSRDFLFNFLTVIWWFGVVDGSRKCFWWEGQYLWERAGHVGPEDDHLIFNHEVDTL